MAERVGQFLGNYQVLRLLGRGAFARSTWQNIAI